MYHIKKRPKFVYYYWESDKEYHESTVKDTFWEELCQGKLVLPSGDLYTSIKTMKRKCNTYSLNEEELWWNQVLDSTSDNFVLCDDETSKKVEKTRKRKSPTIGDAEQLPPQPQQPQVAPNTMAVTTIEKKKRGRKKKIQEGNGGQMQGDDELGESASSQIDSEEGTSNTEIPETRVIEPMSEDLTITCSTASDASNICQELQAVGSSVDPVKQADRSNASSSDETQRQESASAAGVERFLTGVKEIIAGCTFRTRSSLRNTEKVQENPPKERQLFQNLATIIPTSSGDMAGVLGITQSSEFEIPKDSFGPARCKIENEKQLESMMSETSQNAETESELGGLKFPLILPTCYVKLEKIDLHTSSGDDGKNNPPTVLPTQPSTLSSTDSTKFTIGEYGSMKTISEIKYLYGLGDDLQSLSDACQLERTRQSSQVARDAMYTSRTGLKRSASDSILAIQPYRRSKVDSLAASKMDEGVPLFQMWMKHQDRVVGHVIDEPQRCAHKKVRRNVKRKVGRKKFRRIKVASSSQEASCDSHLTADHSSENLHEENDDVNLQDEAAAEENLDQHEMQLEEENFDEQKPNISGDHTYVMSGQQTLNSTLCSVPVAIENISPIAPTIDADPEDDLRDICTSDIFDCINMEVDNLEIRTVSIALDREMTKLPEKIFQDEAAAATEPDKSIERTDIPDIIELENEPSLIDPVEIDITPLPVIANMSITSITSSIDLPPAREGASNMPVSSVDPSVVQIPWMENKKRKGNQFDPRILIKKPLTKKPQRPVKVRRNPQYDEKQLLEDCRLKLYKLINEGAFDDDRLSMETESLDDSTVDLERCLESSEKDRIFSSEIAEALQCLNMNPGKEAPLKPKDIPYTCKGLSMEQEPSPSNRSSRPQDPRRRSEQVVREVEAVKDGQKEQDWIELLEGRTVPSFSFLSLRPQQLEVITTETAVENIDNAAILEAVKKGDLRVMEKVVENLSTHVHWDLEQPDEAGNTLVMMAALNDDSQMIILLRNKVDLNRKNYNRRTPLMLAAQHGKLRTVATLLELGAHIDLRDYKARTALLLAVENNQDHVTHLLLCKGANFSGLTLTSNNFKDSEEQERANRINVCLNSHITWVSKYFDMAVHKFASDLGVKRLRPLSAVQFMTPRQAQKLEFTFKYRPDERSSQANEDRKVVLFGSQCIVQYNWFDGEIPMQRELVGGVKCNGIRTSSYEDSAFLLVNVNKEGFNLISIGIRPDLLDSKPKVGSLEKDKLAFRAYEVNMPPTFVNKFASKKIV